MLLPWNFSLEVLFWLYTANSNIKKLKNAALNDSNYTEVGVKIDLFFVPITRCRVLQWPTCSEHVVHFL